MKETGTESASGRVNVVVEDIAGRCFLRARESEAVDDGLAAILVPRFDGAVLRRLLMPRLKKPFFRISLDRFGTFVWNAIDGRTTVRGITDRFVESHPDEDKVPERVALFVRTLAIQGHVVEVQPPDACESGAAAG